MLENLQKKWKVGGLQLVLILFTFAIGGSLTGYVSRRIMYSFGIEQDWLWILVYIIIVTLLWPFAVLFISVPFGQYRFFINYLKKIGRRMRLVRSPKPGIRDNKINIAIFASGAGSNAAKIINHFRNHPKVQVSLIVCNKPGAGVISIAQNENIPVLLIDKERFFRGDGYVPELTTHQIDWIILAGFLWKVPLSLLRAFPSKMINIHPALLPKYGGKGMYGQYVHEAVLANKDAESGITIHYVDDQYDHGATIFQARCEVKADDTASSLANRIHQLEHQHYPSVIEKLLS